MADPADRVQYILHQTTGIKKAPRKAPLRKPIRREPLAKLAPRGPLPAVTNLDILAANAIAEKDAILPSTGFMPLHDSCWMVQQLLKLQPDISHTALAYGASYFQRILGRLSAPTRRAIENFLVVYDTDGQLFFSVTPPTTTLQKNAVAMYLGCMCISQKFWGDRDSIVELSEAVPFILKDARIVKNPFHFECTLMRKLQWRLCKIKAL